MMIQKKYTYPLLGRHLSLGFHKKIPSGYPDSKEPALCSEAYQIDIRNFLLKTSPCHRKNTPCIFQSKYAVFQYGQKLEGSLFHLKIRMKSPFSKRDN